MSEPPKPPFTVKAVFDYKSDYEDDLTFSIGQIIQVTAVEDEDWYSGNYDGKSGMFPKNFVQIEEKKIKREVPQPPKPVAPVESKPIESEPIESPESKPEPVSEPTKIEKKVESNVPKSMPVFPSKKIEDPYAVNKQFIASSKSSYVPQIKPRDNSFLIGGHGQHQDIPKDADIVRQSTTVEEEEPEEAKLSLKERIALLQKRQEEEAEREAAALKRQELRKQKAAEEKERVKKQREEAAEHPAEPEDVDESEPVARKSLDTSHTGGSYKSAVSTRSQDHNEPENDTTGEHDEDIEEGDEEEEDQDEDDEDDEDEELKRRKLVERMAKMSGGRNMFGMMGMPAFGGGAPASKSNSKPKKEVKSEPVEETESQEPVAVPIMPFADPSALAKLKKGTHLKEDVEEYESPSLGEDDNPTDAAVHNLPPVPMPPSSADILSSEVVNQTQSGLDTDTEKGDVTLPINKGKLDNKLDMEPTGYEADEDISDLNKINSSVESTPILKTSSQLDEASKELPETPPIPTRESRPPPPEVPSIPDRASAPPIPQIPSLPETGLAPSVPTRERHAPPPPPEVKGAPPVPPIPGSVPPGVADYDVEDREANESDEFEFETPNRSYTLPPNLPPPIPVSHPSVPGHSPPVPAPIPGMNRAATDIQPMVSSHTGNSVSSSLRRPSTDISGKGETQAETYYEALEYEIGNIKSTSSWWLKDQLPEFLAVKIGIELIYEVDTNQIHKRGGVTNIYKDYYVLFYDLSQLSFELEYELDDPRSTVKLTNFSLKPIPIIRKDLLDKYHAEYGNQILELVNSLPSNEQSIPYVFKQLSTSVLPPIGVKSYGVNIYRNLNNHQIAKIDEIKRGDILCVKNGKFQVHKGLGSKTIIVGDEEIYSAIIIEYDSKKDKFTVIESGDSKPASYKLSEMKSGHVRVYRVVSKEYVGW